MTSLERLGVVLQGGIPDRVPCFILPHTHGARLLGLTVREYFSATENVVEGQARLLARYGSDCVSSFFGAAVELEAWGGEVIFPTEGPAVLGPPIVKHADDILKLEPPRIGDAPCLQRVLEATAGLRSRCRDAAVLGVVLSPFTLPSLQLGLELYLEVLTERPDLLEHLLKVNEEYAVAWGNAQLAAGATLLCYFDPFSSPTMIPPELS